VPGSSSITGVNNNQGPGFGEFYDDNFYNNANNFVGGTIHSEIMMGGLALRPGSGEIMSTAMDPMKGRNSIPGSDVTMAGGVRTMSNKDGSYKNGLILIQTFTGRPDHIPGSLGKGLSLGDLELICDNVGYMEIGNRLWIDTDKDGVQDANEKSLPGVVVNLYDKVTGALIASTTTNADGEYYFNTTTNAPGMAQITDYTLVYGVGQFNNNQLTLGGKTYYLSPGQTGQGISPQLNDSNPLFNNLSVANGAMPAGLPQTSVTTGFFGYVNHTLDAGFVVCPKLELLGADQIICQGQSLSTIGVRDLNGSKPKYQWFNNNGTANPNGFAIAGERDSVLYAPPVVPGEYKFRVVATVTVNGFTCTDSKDITVTIKPLPRLRVTDAVCNIDLQTYNIITETSGTLTATAGTVVGNTVINIPKNTSVEVTATLDGCVVKVNVAAPNCVCPFVQEPVSGGIVTICTGSPMAAISATVRADETVDWYSSALGGTPLATGTTTFTPTAPGVYWAAARNTINNCVSVVRTPVQLLQAVQPNIEAFNPVAICDPGTVELKDLATIRVVDNAGTAAAGGYPKFYTTPTDAFNNTNAMVNTVVRTSGRYYIRWQTAAGCFDTTSVYVNIRHF
jgi:SdrD B-like domain/Ig-like domain CHU_C associated